MQSDIKIVCKNDIVFKYLMLQDIRLVKAILYGVTHYHNLDIPTYDDSELQLKNPYLLPHNYNGKSIIFDLAIEDELQVQYDIEMQNTSFHPDLYARFHYYGSFMVVSQLHQGEDYRYMRPCHQIILIDDIGEGDTLVKTIQPKDQYGYPELKTHLYTHYVYMPYINNIAKERGLEKLSLFEKVIYAIENDMKGGILELEEEVINCMNNNKNLFMNNEQNIYLVMSQTAAKLTENQLRYDLQEAREEINKKDNLISQKENVISEKENVITEKENVIIQKSKALQEAIDNLMKKLNYSYEEAIAVLGINQEVLG